MNTQPLLLPIFFKPPLCLWSLPCIQYSPNPLFPLITSHCEWFTQGPLSLLSIVLIPHLPPCSWLCSLIPNFVHFASTSCIWLCPPPHILYSPKTLFSPLLSSYCKHLTQRPEAPPFNNPQNSHQPLLSSLTNPKQCSLHTKFKANLIKTHYNVWGDTFSLLLVAKATWYIQ